VLTIIESVNSSDSGDSEIRDSSANDKIIVIVMILQLLLTVNPTDDFAWSTDVNTDRKRFAFTENAGMNVVIESMC